MQRDCVPQDLERVMELHEVAESLDVGNWTACATLSRALALAGLPRKPTTKPRMTRTLRLGKNLWLRVFYATTRDQLPYGADRFVLAGIQHLALKRKSPIVLFDQFGDLLKLFDLDEGGTSFKRLRERLSRVTGLAVELNWARSEGELRDAPLGEQSFMIRKWSFPTQQELKEMKHNVVKLDELRRHWRTGPEHDVLEHPYGVILSEYFWEHLQEAKQQLLVPVEVLKKFLDKPVGWDYLMFLVYRCTRARRESVVPHDILMGLFRDSEKEPERNVIGRLQRYHDEVMLATGWKLDAELCEMKVKGGRGRPKKRWYLKVRPSEPLIQSGKR